MTEKKGIIFDMDGTLWDSASAVAQCWTRVVAESDTLEKVITEEDLQRVMGKTMDLLAAALFPELPERRRMELLEECCRAENEYLRTHGGRLYPDLEETLQKLREKYPLYIVSNCQSGYIEAFLEYYRFGKYFDDIECYGNNGLEKGENIRRLAERNHLTDAVYVGDIQGDYEASRKAGVKFIHAAYGFGEINQKVPKIHGLSQLPQVIEEVLAMRLVSAGDERIAAQLQQLYVKAFPACERKPYDEMEKKRKDGTLDVFAIEEDGSFCGLAISIKYKDIVLLDYFAIEESARNRGCGSRALKLLCEYYQGKRFILEVESTFEDAPNRDQRVARKKFYLRNGWGELDMQVFIYETQMELLGYETRISFEEYRELYLHSYPERLPKRIV